MPYSRVDESGDTYFVHTQEWKIVCMCARLMNAFGHRLWEDT